MYFVQGKVFALIR